MKHFRKRKIIANGIDEIWAVDLVDMRSFSKFNDGIKYLLMAIDIFSKYGWIVPLNAKTGVDVADALNKIFKERRCSKMCDDKGLEFYNKHVKALLLSSDVRYIPLKMKKKVVLSNVGIEQSKRKCLSTFQLILLENMLTF